MPRTMRRSRFGRRWTRSRSALRGWTQMEYAYSESNLPTMRLSSFASRVLAPGVVVGHFKDLRDTGLRQPDDRADGGLLEAHPLELTHIGGLAVEVEVEIIMSAEPVPGPL